MATTTRLSRGATTLARLAAAATWLHEAGLRVADAVIVTTAELADYAARRVTRARVHLIPNGVDVARFAPGEQGRTAPKGRGPAGGRCCSSAV
jgi:glycosyltransferase involved in cell wall biosynthesis